MQTNRLVMSHISCIKCNANIPLHCGNRLLDGIFALSVTAQNIIFEAIEENKSVVCNKCIKKGVINEDFTRNN